MDLKLNVFLEGLEKSGRGGDGVGEGGVENISGFLNFQHSGHYFQSFAFHKLITK